jgi:hypothetical protein
MGSFGSGTDLTNPGIDAAVTINQEETDNSDNLTLFFLIPSPATTKVNTRNADSMSPTDKGE